MFASQKLIGLLIAASGAVALVGCSGSAGPDEGASPRASADGDPQQPDPGVETPAAGIPMTPMTYNGLVPVADPKAYPASTSAKLAVKWPGGLGSACSGTFIDPRHVLTAGHCVYNSDYGGTASSVVVSGTLGSQARSVNIDVYGSYLNGESSHHDIAVLFLDRPIGGEHGFAAYSGADCDALTSPTVTVSNYSYPAEGPFIGKFVFRSGRFDECASPSLVIADGTQSYQGQSGSGYLTIKDGKPYVRAVHSGKWPEVSQYFAARLSDPKVAFLSDLLKTRRPSEADLMPFRVKKTQTKVDVTPSGGKITGVSFIVTNYSTQSWSGTLNATLRLSKDAKIDKTDKAVGTFAAFSEIGSLKSKVITVPDGAVTIPSSTEVGGYFFGVTLEESDADTSNNAAGPDTGSLLPNLTVTH